MEIKLRDPSEVPIEYGEAQYLLYCDWLPEEDRTEDYEPDLFMALFEDGTWWLMNSGIEREGDSYFLGEVFRPVDFSPIEEWYTILGWYPLFGAESK